MSIVHIQTTPEVRKFVLFECRDQVYLRGKEPIIKLNRKMLVGNMIACLMNDDLTDFIPQRRPPVYLSFEVSRRFDRCYLTEQGQKRISLHLDRWFKQDFCKYVDSYSSLSLEFDNRCHDRRVGINNKLGWGRIESALQHYRSNYHISEEDSSFDAMRTYYMRYGKRNFRNAQKLQAQRLMIESVLQPSISSTAVA